MITQEELLRSLNAIDYPRRYWEFSDRYPSIPYALNPGRKEDIAAAFKEIGVKPKLVERVCYEVESEEIGGEVWSGEMVKKSNWLEFRFGNSLIGSDHVGGELTSLAYEAAQLANPSFQRDPPYPRPEHNGDPETIKQLVKDYVAWVRILKDVVRKLESEK
jgi:hypothetical protein